MASQDLDTKLDRLSIAAGSASSSANPNRISKQYAPGGSQNKPFIPGSGMASGSRIGMGGSTSYFGSAAGPASGHGAGSSANGAAGAAPVIKQERGPLTRVGGGVTNIPTSMSGAGYGSANGRLGGGMGERKPSVDRLNAQIAANKAAGGGGVPMVDVGRYDGGLERDERKGRRTGEGSELLNVDSAAGG